VTGTRTSAHSRSAATGRTPRRSCFATNLLKVSLLTEELRYLDQAERRVSMTRSRPFSSSLLRTERRHMRKLVFVFLTMLLSDIAHSAQLDKILNADEFAQNRVPRCSGSPAGLPPITMRVSISPKLPAYQFKLITQPAAAGGGDAHAIGKIEISIPPSGTIVQTIEAKSKWDWGLCQFFTSADVNFDGYLDISFVRDGGAKWASREYYIFDPRSGRYISNALTQDLAGVQENGISFDSQTHEIRAPFMGPEACRGGLNVYRIQNGRLSEVQEEKVTPSSGQCIRETRRRMNGRWSVTVLKEPELRSAP